MLDIQRRIDVDALRQNLLNIHITLGMAAAGGIGVSQFIDQNQSGTTGQNGIEIHLLQHLTPIIDATAVDDLETLHQRFGFPPAMGFNDADDGIHTIRQLRPAGHQHFIGLADAGRCAQKNLQPAPRLAPGVFQQRIGRWSARHITIVVRHLTHQWSRLWLANKP
ncbi:hypothetical protein D3C78_1081520 [compost metagenome]